MENEESVEQDSTEAAECFALVLKEKLLPTTVDELVPLCFVGEMALQFYRTKLEGLKNVAGVNAQLDATFKNGLQVAEMLFRVHERLGQLVEENTASPVDSGKAGGKGVPMENSLPSVSKMAKDLNVSRKRLEDAKSIARAPQFIETVLDDARKSDVLPSKTKLLSVIRAGYPSKGVKQRSKTLAKKCTEAILEASSYMKAITELWEDILGEEKNDFARALFEFEYYAEQLRERYALLEEKKGA